MDWQSNSLQSKIKGRGGRRFLASIPLSQVSVSSLGEENCPNFACTLSEPLSVPLPEDEAHHAVSVLRLKEDELVSIFDPSSQIEGLGFLKNTIRKATIFAEIHHIQKSTFLYPSLLVGLPKQKTAETLTEKACEIGVSNIFFFIADHSISKNMSDKDIAAKSGRVLSTRNSAIKQSYASYAPSVRIFCDLESCLDSISIASFSNAFFCEPSYYLHTEDETVQNAAPPIPLMRAATSCTAGTGSIIAIGPEGGFSLREQKTFLEMNFSLLTLGQNVLRVDTAAVYALAAFGANLTHE